VNVPRPLVARTQEVDVAEHLRQRHEALHEGLRPLLALVGHLATTTVHVADDVAQVVGFGDDLDPHHRLEQLRTAHLVRFAEAAAAGDFERERRRVDVVELAVDQARLEVDDFVAGHLAAHGFRADRVFDRGNELARHAATHDFVGELDAAAGSSGSNTIFTSANWPEPPDCFLCV
jgi:hypothetical protein